MKAAFDGTCARCHNDYYRGDQIVRHRNGSYMHVACSSGQDEE